MTKVIEKLNFILKLVESNLANTKKIELVYKECTDAIKEVEALQNRKCENCKHYSTGKQPDGFKWNKCEYNFECKTCFNDYFERAEQ